MFKCKFCSPFVFVLSMMLPFDVYGQQSDWEPAEAPPMSKWADEESLKYLRPMMEREHWQNLNGLRYFKMIGRSSNLMLSTSLDTQRINY